LLHIGFFNPFCAFLIKSLRHLSVSPTSWLLDGKMKASSATGIEFNQEDCGFPMFAICHLIYPTLIDPVIPRRIQLASFKFKAAAVGGLN
jgi:hypothetical protein